MHPTHFYVDAIDWLHNHAIKPLSIKHSNPLLQCSTRTRRIMLFSILTNNNANQLYMSCNVAPAQELQAMLGYREGETVEM